MTICTLVILISSATVTSCRRNRDTCDTARGMSILTVPDVAVKSPLYRLPSELYIGSNCATPCPEVEPGCIFICPRLTIGILEEVSELFWQSNLIASISVLFETAFSFSVSSGVSLITAAKK